MGLIVVRININNWTNSWAPYLEPIEKVEKFTGHNGWVAGEE